MRRALRDCALYGISPSGTDPAEDGLEPALRWDSELAQVKLLQPGESTGYGCAADRATASIGIGIVPGSGTRTASGGA